MRCDLKIWSKFGGESTEIRGRIEVDGLNCTIEAEGSAADRGTHAKVNGQEQWWNSEGDNAVENAVDEIFELVCDHVDSKGGGMDVLLCRDGDWTAHVVDGVVKSVVFGTDPH